MPSRDEVSLPPIADDLDVGVMVHDPESGEILAVNDRVEELYGYTAAELRRMEVGDVTAPSTRYDQELAVSRIRDAAAGTPRTFEWQVERNNGEYRWVRVHLDRTTIGGTECVLAEIRDVTEYRNRERRLRLLSRILRHNLRNEMSILMGHAERLQSAIEADRLEDDVETIVDVANDVSRLSDSVTQIEEIARPHSTGREPTNLSTVVRSIADEVEDTSPEVDVTVETAADVWVRADASLRYAIDHAVDNAIEHNDRDRPSVRLSVECDPATDRGLVRVADDAPPIPDVEIEVLDAVTETDSTFHGTGVGLWVMQWCIDALGGELGFETGEPRGNVVTVSLPTIDPPDDEG